jgi:hypothetical protein
VARLAASGVVNFYRVRANGSARFLPYLAQGTEAREVAEWAALQVEEGRSVAWLAEDAGVSRATVRRALAALDLAEDIEAGEYDELVTDDVDAVFVGDADADDATVGKGIGPVTDVTNFDFHVVTEDKR